MSTPSAPTALPVDAGMDQRFLEARQIRLYIENSPVLYLASAVFATGLTCALIWPYLPLAHVEVLLWLGFITSTVLMRSVGWLAFSRAKPEDGALGPWLKWFVGPQLCSMTAMGAAPLLFLPAGSGHEVEVIMTLTAFICLVALASCIKLSAYRPLIPTMITPMLILFSAGTLRLPGFQAKLLGVGGLAIGLIGYPLAVRFNQALVRTMELSLRNQRLVAALEVRTAQLEEQRLAAESAVRDKTRFLAAASHDLRQPMHAISLLVGMLRPRASGAEREVVERLERSVESMDGLFDTILDISKLDAGVVTPVVAEFPIRAIFDSIEVHFAPQAASKGLTLKVLRSRAAVATDRAVLERLLRNLVSNAIKYTHEGKVLVGCRRRGGRLQIGVWDTGVGIGAENVERIFEEYFQVDAGPRNRSEGLGLGLSIVRRLARLLGSEIKVTSAPGRGSRFDLDVPFAGYAPVEPQARTEEPGPDRALEGKYILVVDDEPDVCFGAEALLREWGCRSASAGSLRQVEALLDRELRFPDALITDFRLGDRLTGLDVIAAVRRYSGERTPAVVVTGEDLGSAELEHDGEFYPIVKKPLAAEELRRRLVAVLRQEALRTS